MGQFSGQRKEGVLGFFTVIGWTATILGLVNARLISYQAGAYALLGMVIIVALSAILRSSLVRATLRVALPLAALAFLVIREGQGDMQAMKAMAGAIVALLVALFGLYIMIRGLFR